MSMSYWLPIALLWLPGILATCVWKPGSRHLHPGVVISLGYLTCALLAAFSVPLADRILGTIAAPALLAAYAALVGLFWLLCWATLRWRPAPASDATIPVAADKTSRWELLAIPLLGLILARLWQLAVESTGRPLMAWDAWHSWAAKAKVWTANEALSAFHQLQMTGRSVPEGYFTRLKHPDTLPWLMSWFSISGGGWNEPMLGLLYISLLVAIAVLFYAVARQLGGNRLIGVAAMLLVASLPYVNTHVALPGYADLWLAAYFVAGAAIIQLMVLEPNRDRRLLWIGVLVCLVAAPAIKMTGVAWSGILAAAVVVAILPRLYWLLLATPVVIVAGLMLWQPERLWLPMAGKFWRLEFENVTEPLLNVLFALRDWHLLWWLFLCALCLAPSVPTERRSLRPANAAICLSATFLLVGYYFSPRSSWVLDYTAVNRALLPLALLAALWLVLFLVTRWRTEWSATG